MGTGFWIILAVLAVLLLATGKTKNNGKSQGGTKGTASRIDHRHYLDPDEYECPRCGANFRSNTMQCPNCGTRFTGTREDMTAYDDELEEELDMDEWDEEEK